MLNIGQMEFPVGTGIYRTSGREMDNSNRVPCREQEYNFSS